jgi:hypothetical protein
MGEEKGRSTLAAPPPHKPGDMLFLSRTGRRPAYPAAWAAIEAYLHALSPSGELRPGWEPFERALAVEYAILMIAIRALPTDQVREEFLKTFLEGLNLANKRGSRRKERTQLAYMIRGAEMHELWRREVEEPWNRRTELDNARIAKHYKDDVVNAILGHKATKESVIAEVYAVRSRDPRISPRTARNALAKYEGVVNTRLSERNA